MYTRDVLQNLMQVISGVYSPHVVQLLMLLAISSEKQNDMFSQVIVSVLNI